MVEPYVVVHIFFTEEVTTHDEGSRIELHIKEIWRRLGLNEVLIEYCLEVLLEVEDIKMRYYIAINWTFDRSHIVLSERCSIKTELIINATLTVGMYGQSHILRNYAGRNAIIQ